MKLQTATLLVSKTATMRKEQECWVFLRRYFHRCFKDRSTGSTGSAFWHLKCRRDTSVDRAGCNATQSSPYSLTERKKKKKAKKERKIQIWAGRWGNSKQGEKSSIPQKGPDPADAHRSPHKTGFPVTVVTLSICLETISPDFQSI